MAKATAQTRKNAGVTAAATFGRPDVLIVVALAVVTLGLYAQVVGHQFITLDDPTYIQENSMVNRGLTRAGLGWALTTFHATNWHPLTWISHMVDCQLFGMNAGGHLLVNAVIHAANTLLVFWFLLRTTRARWPSALVAALFALHPLHVESVAWASERKDTLSTFFGLFSLIAYARYAEKSSGKWYAWTVATLALGLLAKPMLVTWPLVMLLLDYWPLCRFHAARANRLGLPRYPETTVELWPLLREKLPLFILVTASAVITFVAQSHEGAVSTFTAAPVALRLSNALVSYAKYLLLTFWPTDLAICYPFAQTGIPAWQIIGAAFLLIGITAFCLFQRRSAPYLIVGWLWFLGTLVPVIGIVQVGGQTMADRYFYIPSIGLFIALVFGLADIAKVRGIAPSLSAAIAGAVLVVFAALTNAQIRRWHDSFTLFEHALAVTQRNFLAEDSLGMALARNGKHDEAAAHFEKTLQIQPNFYYGLVNMGATRVSQGRLREAIEYLQAAIRVHPGLAKAHMGLGVALAKQKRYDSAEEELRRALELAPKDADIRSDLGLVLARLGRMPEALDQLHKALRLNPNNAEAHNNLGLALLASSNARESIPEFEAALRLKPKLKVAADNLQRAQAQLSSQR